MFPDEKSESLRGLFDDGDEYRTNDRFLFTQYRVNATSASTLPLPLPPPVLHLSF